MSIIYEVKEKGGYDWCIHCETCGDEMHEYFESSSDTECFVCHNRKCLNSFGKSDIEIDEEEEWHCPECKSSNVMVHERCQCDEPTISDTVYQVHGDGSNNCWPTYHHNATKRVFECTKCRDQFDINLRDTTEDTEGRKAKRCPTCNSMKLDVKDVKFGDKIPSKRVEWFDC